MDGATATRPAPQPLEIKRLWIGTALLALAGLGLLFIPRPSHSGSTLPRRALLGTVLSARPAAPSFRLTDQFGHSVALSSFRGHPVVLTFMETQCKQLCPRVADELRQMVDDLGPAAHPLTILAISTDPEGDARSSIVTFSRRHGMLRRWHYLTAPRTELAAIWRAYYIYAAPAGSDSTVDTSHTSATYIIDGQGRERVIMSQDLSLQSMEWDVRVLSGLPVQAFALQAAPEVGHPAPDFSLTRLDGARLRLRDLRGKIVLLNFWATWCHACRSEMPRLAAWYRQHRSQGVVVVGVDQQESNGTVAAYLRRLRVPYPVGLDDGAIFVRYSVVGLPSSYLVDRQGIVRAVTIGVVTPRNLARQVRPLLAGKGGI